MAVENSGLHCRYMKITQWSLFSDQLH